MDITINLSESSVWAIAFLLVVIILCWTKFALKNIG